MNINPKRILHLGAGIGYLDTLLKSKFPKAKIINVDIDRVLLARPKSFWQKTRITSVVAQHPHLPFKRRTFDLIFVQGPLDSVESPLEALISIYEVLAPKGMLFIQTFGPGTAADYAIANHHDMHDWGDALAHLHLKDVVLDQQTVTLTYKKPETYFNDLREFCDINNCPPKDKLQIEYVFGHGVKADVAEKTIMLD